MNRLLAVCGLMFMAVSSVGCCYRPGYCDPCTGMAYGGHWEPVCGGPLDPLGWWCGGAPWNCGICNTPGMTGCSHGPSYSVSPGVQSSCGGIMTTPQTFVVPGSEMPMQPTPSQKPPTPAPGAESKNPSSSMIVPSPMPLQQGQILQGASSAQWVPAH